MSRVFWVAWREFMATVATKAFIIGIVLPPLMVVVIGKVMPLLTKNSGPAVTGHIAVIDASGVVADRLEAAFQPEAVKNRREEAVPAAVRAVQSAVPEAAVAAQQAAPSLTVVKLPADASPEKVAEAKQLIREAQGKEKDAGGKGESPRLALIVVPPGAVRPPQPNAYEDFDMFLTPRLDVEVESDIESQVQRAIVDARIEASKLSVVDVRAMIKRPKARAVSVTNDGEKQSTDAEKVARLMVPAAFMFLIYISVMVCGQGLLASTIEEKSSRVMEMVLSAVTPVQLLIGKILGQMAVGLLLVGVYAATGMAALVLFTLVASVDLMNLVWLAVFFVIAFGMMASLFAAVGSAVNDIREAQTLQTPLMLVILIPIILWYPILRNPNSGFAQVMSFVPPASPFVMVLRLAGSEKIPAWQVPASIIVGLVFVALFLWVAAKIFRIGVLMYGKPPDLATLIKWVRMA